MNNKVFQFQARKNLWVLGSSRRYSPALDIEFLRPLRELKEEVSIEAVMVSGKDAYRAVERYSNENNLSFRREKKLFIPENRNYYSEVYNGLTERTVHLLTGKTGKALKNLLG